VSKKVPFGIKVLVIARTNPFTNINQLRDADVAEPGFQLLAGADDFHSILISIAATVNQAELGKLLEIKNFYYVY
jgi:hypothetical protein